MATQMTLHQDFKEFIEKLNAHNVRYLVVGGYAVAFHGKPRYTKDLDIWILIEKQNAEKIIAAIKDFGLGSLGFTPEDFLSKEDFVQMGIAPYRIDILTEISGIYFETAYEKRIEAKIDDVLVKFIDLESLKANKRATGRLQDLADVENLE